MMRLQSWCGLRRLSILLSVLLSACSLSPSPSQISTTNPPPAGYVWRRSIFGLYRMVPADIAKKSLYSLAEMARTNTAAWRRLRARASGGDATAQYLVGAMYAMPPGSVHTVSFSPMRSLRWYIRSATKGDVHAELALIHIYRTGMVARINTAKAEFWLRRVALQGDQGDGFAERSLAERYQIGVDVPQSDATALTWWRAAARRGDLDSEAEMARFYQIGGDGLQPNPARAIFWEDTIEKSGHLPASLTALFLPSPSSE